MAKAKIHKKNVIDSGRQTERTLLWHIAFWGLAVLLFLPPFFRGLFFATEQRKALLFAIIILLLVCLWKWLRKDYTVLSHPMDYFMLALPAVYIIASFNSINSGLAVDEIVKAILYFIVYWLVVQLIRDLRDAETLIYVIYGSAILVALAALMTATGLINIKDGFSNERLASSFQYANALASFMAAVFAMGVYLWWKFSCQVNENQDYKARVYKYISFLIAVGNCLLVAVLVGAKSNGGFIVFGLGVLLMLVLVPGINRLFVLIHMAMVAVPAAGIIFFFLVNVKEKHATLAWLWVLAGLILTVVLQWLFLTIIQKIFQKENPSRKLLIGGLTFIVIMGLFISFTSLGEIKVLTGKFKADSLAHRVYFIEDAINMVKERPVFGWGGGGWQEAYQYFQSYSYVSRQVHSHYIQVAVETGAAGILAVAGLWLSFLYTLYRAYRKRDKMLTTFLGVSVLIFGIHAAVDFDLSLSALSLVLYTSMAVIRNIDRGIFEEMPPAVVRKNTGKPVLILTASIGLLALLLVIPLLTAQSYYRNAMDLYKKGDKSAVTYMEKAVFYDPFHVEYRVALSDLHRAVGQLDKSLTDMNQALLRSKYSPDIRAGLSQFVLQGGDPKKAVKYAEEAIELAPWQIAYYEFAGNVYKSAGLMELKNKNLQEANKHFSAALNLPKKIQEKRNSLDSFKQKYSNSLGTTPKIALTTGVSEFLVGNIKDASVNLKRALDDQNTKGEAYVWLGLLSEKQGDLKSAEKNLNEAKKISPQLENSYQELKHLLM